MKKVSRRADARVYRAVERVISRLFDARWMCLALGFVRCS
jgi:hypothetical protein